MQLSLPPKFRKLIDDRIRSGKYATPEDVVKAALTSLDQAENLGDFAPGELDTLIAEGEASLKSHPSIPAEEVFKEIRNRSSQRRASRK